jgi:diguanylate cyclase (GGDEF)-like protein/PAS domain S-box-containing protein
LDEKSSKPWIFSDIKITNGVKYHHNYLWNLFDAGIFSIRSSILPQKKKSAIDSRKSLPASLLEGVQETCLPARAGEDILEHKHTGEAQENPEQRYRELTEFLPISVFEIDTSGNLISYNQSTLQTFRYSREDFQEGTNVLRFVPSEELNRVKRIFRKVYLGGSVHDQQYVLIRKDGSTFTGSIFASPIYKDRKIIGVRGAIIDITEHSQTQTLQEAVYRIAAATETTRSLDELYPKIHQIISSVMPAENFYITLYDEVQNLLRFSYFKDAEDEPFIGGIQPGKGLTAYVLRTGKSLLCTQTVHDELERQGEVKLLGVPSAIWLGVPLIVEGKTIGAMVVQHYTDPNAYGEREQHMLEFVSTQVAIAINRKRAEDALRQSEAELRALFSSMHDLVMVIDRDGVYRKIAPTNPEVLVKPAQELLGAKLRDLFQPEEAETFIVAINEVLDTKKSQQIEFNLKIGDRTVWFATSISSMTEDSTLWVAHDITERKRFEQVQNALYRISQTAITNEGIDALYRSIHNILGELIPAENFFIALIDPGSGEISFPYYVDQFDEPPVGMTPQQGLTGYVIRTGVPLMVTKQDIESLAQQNQVERVGTMSLDWMGAPLKVEGALIGVMAVQIYTPGIHYGQEDLSLLEFVSNQVAQAIERKRLDEEIRSLSLTDELTGLYNRRGFTLLAEQEVKLAHRINRPMLLFFCDVDSLKSINDTHGHPQGDLALKEVSAILKDTFRDADILARLGGDEFVVLAVDALLESAETMTSRIQAALETGNQKGQRPYQLNISTGVARCDPEVPSSVSELIVEADRLMYSQKQARKVLH